MKIAFAGLIAGVVVGLLMQPVEAKEETATGYGSSFIEALTNAKIIAAEQAANTFITAKQEVVDDKYKETIGQYSGGLVQKYTIKNTTVNDGMYEVTIDADINTDKINSILENSSADPTIVIPQVEKAVDEYEKSKAVLDAISQVSDPFIIKVDSVTYEVMGNVVLAQYHTHLVWNPKWVDDITQLLKVINRSIRTSRQGICVGQTCGGINALPDYDKWARMQCTATIDYTDNTSDIQTNPANVVDGAAGLFVHNYDQRVNALPPNMFKTVASSIVETALPGGTVMMAMAGHEEFNIVDTLTIYSGYKSTPFDLVVVLPVSKFKEVSAVTFSFSK